MRDGDDFAPTNGYLNNTAILPTGMTNLDACSTTNAPYIAGGIDSGAYDTEPDVFYFNFAGYTGKFMFTPGTTDVVNLMPYQDISIVPNTTTTSPTSWTVKTADGMQYIFGQTETSSATITASLNVPEYILGTCGTSATTCGEGDHTGTITTSFTSSWYLTNITSPAGNSVSFSYVVAGTNTSTYTASEMAFGNSTATTCGSCYNKTVKRSQTVTVTPAVLTQITYSPGGKIVFTSSDRCSSAIDGKKLDKIELFADNTSTSPFKSLALGYYTCNADKRLWLKTVTELGSGETAATTQSPQYGFIYYPSAATTLASATVPTNLATTDKGQDYWGYRNGVTANVNLVPRFVDGTVSPAKYYDGANRSAVAASTTYGALSHIIYPTKGAKKFEYELHDYNNTPNGGNISYATTPNTYTVALNSAGTCTGGTPTSGTIVSTTSFSLTNPALMTITTNCFSAGGSGDVPRAVLQGTTTLGASVILVFAASGVTTTTDGVPVCLTNNAPLTIAPGTYTLSAKTPNTTTAVRFTATFTQHAPNTTKTGGGIRIKSVKLYDAATLLQHTDYEYKTVTTSTGAVGTTSSGVLINDNAFFNTLNQPYNGAVCMNYKTRTTLGTVPLYAMEPGNTVGYSYVSVYDVNVALGTRDNGKVVYEFTNAATTAPTVLSSSGFTAVSLPFLTRNDQADNGFIKNVFTYKYNGSLTAFTKLQQTAYTYASPSSSTVSGMRFRSMIGGTTGTTGTICSNASWITYTRTAMRKQVSSITHTYYDENGANGVATTTNYGYRTSFPFLLNSTEMVNSEAHTYRTEMTYPADYSMTSTTEALKIMKDNFMHAYPIVTRSLIKEAGTTSYTTLQQSITKYGNFTGSPTTTGVHVQQVVVGYPGTDPATSGTSFTFSSTAFKDILITYNTYSTVGNLTNYTQGFEPLSTTIAYDSDQLRPISTTKGGFVETITYDSLFKDQIATQTNVAGNTSSLTYDLRGRVKLAKDFDSNIRQANYYNIK